MTGTYDPRLIALSVLLAVLTAFAALNLVQRVTVSRGLPARGWLMLGALATGAGIWSAQYFAMLALILPVPVVYHLPTMLFALGFSVLVCLFPLWIASGPRISGGRLFVAGVCMGLGVAIVHYTGLFSMQIVPAVFFDPKQFTFSLAVSAIACWLAMWLAFWLRQGQTLLILLARAGAGMLIGAGISGMFFAGLAAARFAPDSYSLGAAADPAADGGDGVLLVIAVAAALLMLVTTILTCIDHARSQPVVETRPAPAAPVDAATLEARFAELHESALETGHLMALMVVGIDAPPGAPEASEAPICEEAARRLATLLRPGDVVAGVELGEFVLLLPGLTEAGLVERIAVRVREEIGREMQVAGSAVTVQPRLGFSLCPADGEDLDTLLRVARSPRTAT
jgi:NO-binding membrane sensor protein with MHYT domain